MKRFPFIFLGLFLFVMASIILGKVENITQSSENMTSTFSKSYKTILDFNNPPSSTEIDTMIESTNISIQSFLDTFINFALTFESAVIFMFAGAISIITGVFGVDFWKALFNFLMPSP